MYKLQRHICLILVLVILLAFSAACDKDEQFASSYEKETEQQIQPDNSDDTGNSEDNEDNQEMQKESDVKDKEPMQKEPEKEEIENPILFSTRKERSYRLATEKSKYDYLKSPLVYSNKEVNRNVMPSFALEDTGFIQGDALNRDLCLETLVFYTSSETPNWRYLDANGFWVSEWEWFDKLWTEIRLTVRANVSQRTLALQLAQRDMLAGKQMDIIYASDYNYPAALCLAKPITNQIAINDYGSAPGICKKTMDGCSLQDDYYVIAPEAVADVLWYNETLTNQLGLSDPHKLWSDGLWNVDTFSVFLRSVPKTDKDGNEITALLHNKEKLVYTFPSVTGIPCISINNNTDKLSFVNNFNSPSTISAWKTIIGIMNDVNFKSAPKQSGYLSLVKGSTVMSGTMYNQMYSDVKNTDNIRLNWVPYPKNNPKPIKQIQNELNKKFNSDKFVATNDGVAQFSGIAMLLPKKSVMVHKEVKAIHFMQLWATRFSEAYLDNLSDCEYFGFTFEQKREYYNFVTQNVVFGMQVGAILQSELVNKTNFFDCFDKNSKYDITEQVTAGASYVSSYLNSLLS